jgi:hypothetical protein
MLKVIESSRPFGLEDADCPALRNQAVARCVAAWDKVYRPIMAKTKSDYFAGKAAGKAFRQAMPLPCGDNNICDFIACTTYGMLIGAIKEENGSKFLYAAHVALGASGALAKSKNQPPTAA